MKAPKHDLLRGCPEEDPQPQPSTRLRLYKRAPGLVARCPACEEVVLRMVRRPEAAWLDMRGITARRIPLG
nr:DUF6510 family protein [Actinomadura catellatispora]